MRLKLCMSTFFLAVSVLTRGCAVSGAILSSTLGRGLSHLPFVDDQLIDALPSSTYSISEANLSPEQEATVLDVYMEGLHYVFIFYAVSAGLACLCSVGVGNTDLKRKKKSLDAEEKDEQQPQQPQQRQGEPQPPPRRLGEQSSSVLVRDAR
jgi:hypothetical protein